MKPSTIAERAFERWMRRCDAHGPKLLGRICPREISWLTEAVAEEVEKLKKAANRQRAIARKQRVEIKELKALYFSELRRG